MVVQREAIGHFQKYQIILCLSLQKFAQTLFPFSTETIMVFLKVAC